MMLITCTTSGRTGLRGTAERGVALIWAILIMLVVMGLIVAIGMTTLNSSRETWDATSKTRALFWAETAAKDIVARIDNGEIGPWVAATDATTGNQYLSMPLTTGLTTPTTTTFPVPGSTTRALPLVNTVNGSQRGWYQILSPVTTQVRPWTGLRVLDPANPDAQGSMQFVIRAWNDTARAKATTVRIELRRGTLARFSMLSENELTLGGLGTLNLAGAIHTNNARDAAMAVELGTNASLGSVTTVSSTKGTISGCNGSGKCKPNVGEVVPFGSGNRSLLKVERLATLPGRCTTTGFVACNLDSGVNAGIASVSTMPAWHVYVNGAGGCVTVRTMSFPMRQDTGTYGLLDDRAGPATDNNSLRSYCPAAGGGALLFNGDVIVSGQRAAGTPPVTIFARRTATFPRRTVNGVANQAITSPASIYFLQAGGAIGAASPSQPLGLVAQGGIYLPGWAMKTVNNVLNVTNVAAMAVTGEIAYGPSIMAVAADGSAPGGEGILPAQARLLGYGYGASFSFTGSLASSGRMVFRYGVNNAQYLGYGTRNIAYVDPLSWNPPPFYPADSDWHLADWTEFSG